MLQIRSGKLYPNGSARENTLTGVIYTNLRVYSEKKIETAAGSILPTSHLDNSMSLIYQFSEKMEDKGDRAGILVSHGIEPYISDFSAILSFALSCVATPDQELSNRLTSNRRGLSTPAPPNKIVHRFFDPQVVLRPNDESHLVKFLEHLVGLRRMQYLGVVRAIRTYVTGMHRIADDFELAYTLIVAAIESMAQDFDDHDATWDDIDQRKRKLLDKALKEADIETSKRVKSALLEIEQASLSKRFRSFVIQNLSERFFRAETYGVSNPIARSDLVPGLKQAYTARSKYVHNLKELPRLLTLGSNSSEIAKIDNQTWFTLQGISRIAKHVITEYVFKQQTVENESYDFGSELAGTVAVPLAPQYWVGNVENFRADSGTKRLEGFLQQFAKQILPPKETSITDLRPVLNKAESLLPQMKKSERLPFITLFFLFNAILPKTDRKTWDDDYTQKYLEELKNPTPESLIYHLIYDQTPDWTLSDHNQSIIRYFKSRENRLKLKLPRLFEAGVILALGERYRLAGNYKEAKIQVSFAVENCPESLSLRQFEQDYNIDNELEINWSNILIPIEKNE